MPLQTLFARTLPNPSQPHHPRRLSRRPPPALIRRRPPIVGALCFLSIGALAALAYRTGCAQSLRSKLPLLGSKSPARALHSSSSAATMEAGSATVPSIVVYVTVPNKEADYGAEDEIDPMPEDIEYFQVLPSNSSSSFQLTPVLSAQARSSQKALLQKSLLHALIVYQELSLFIGGMARYRQILKNCS